MAESFKDKAAGDRNIGNGSSSVWDCAGLRSLSSEHSLTGESASIKTDGNPELRVLYMDKCSLYLNYLEIFDTCSAFGEIERIQIKTFTEFNSFYVKFVRAEDARRAFKTMAKIKVAGEYINTTLFNHKNITDKDDDYVPEVEISEASTERKTCKSPSPVYNIVTAEEGHNPIKVFKHLNKLISKPKITPETFKKFGRNTYLVKVQPRQGFMIQGTLNQYHDSGIISIRPYDDYNGSKGKIFNTHLAKFTKEEMLEMCPPIVVDCFNITKYDSITKSRINTPTMILKFSSQIPPDQIEIGPFRIRVKSYTCSPKTCTSCLKFGHNKNRCTSGRDLCINCGEEHQDLDEDFRRFCEKPTKCHHCQGDDTNHKTFNNACPEYKKQKEICNIAYNQRTSFFEANKIYHQKNGLSFANAVIGKRPNNPATTNRNQQGLSTTTQSVPKLSLPSVTPTSQPELLTPAQPAPSSSMRPAQSPSSSLMHPVQSAQSIRSIPTQPTQSSIQPTPSNSKASNLLKSSTATLSPKVTTSQSVTTTNHQSSKSKQNLEKNKKSSKSKTSSLTDLSNLDDDLFSTEFKPPKNTKAPKPNNDESKISVDNRFEILSLDAEEIPSSNRSERNEELPSTNISPDNIEDAAASNKLSDDSRKDRKRKSSETPEETTQPSCRKKITPPGSGKQPKPDKNSGKQKPPDSKATTSNNKATDKTKKQS